MNTITAPATVTISRDDLRAPDARRNVLRGKTGQAVFLDRVVSGKFWASTREVRIYPTDSTVLPEGEAHIKLYSSDYNNLVPHTLHSLIIDI